MVKCFAKWEHGWLKKCSVVLDQDIDVIFFYKNKPVENDKIQEEKQTNKQKNMNK